MDNNRVQEQLTILRPRYRERQVLRAGDLQTEQIHRVELHRRHLGQQHTWGVVYGLELVPNPNGIVLEQGLAVDGFGRELCVPDSALIPRQVLDSYGGNADVWLLYDCAPVSTPRRGRYACGRDHSNRSRQQVRLRLTAANAGIDPRCPIPGCDDPFRAEVTPDAEWPVYVGTVTNGGAQGARAKVPFVKLVGQRVIAPSGRTQLDVGGESAQDFFYFAVSVRDSEKQNITRLGIDRYGNSRINGHAVLTYHEPIQPNQEAESISDLRFERDGSEPQMPGTAASPAPLPECEDAADDEPSSSAPIRHGIRFHPPVAEPKAARPWQIYRTRIEHPPDPAQLAQAGAVQSPQPSPAQPPPKPVITDELRIEMAHPGGKGNPAAFRVVVGARQADGQDKTKFTPCLTIDGTCTVRVTGQVRVHGTLVKSPIRADPNDPRFVALMSKAHELGILYAFLGTPLPPTP